MAIQRPYFAVFKMSSQKNTVKAHKNFFVEFYKNSTVRNKQSDKNDLKSFLTCVYLQFCLMNRTIN